MNTCHSVPQFINTWWNAAFDIAEWTRKQPVEYLSVSIPLVALSIWSGVLLLTAFARRERLA